MKYARDVMTPHPVKLELETSIDKAIDLFLENRFHSLPVVDDKNKAQGVLTEISVLKIIAMRAKYPEKDKIKDYSQLIEEAIHVQPDAVVKDFMADVVSKGHNRILVMNPDKVLIGVISPRDVLHLLSGKALKRLQAEKTAIQELIEKQKAFYAKVDPNQLYYQAFEKTSQIMALINEQGHFLAANAAFRLTFGYQAEDISQLKVEHVWDDAYQSEIYNSIQTLKNEGKASLEKVSFTKNVYHKIDAQLDFSLIKDVNSKFLAALILVYVLPEKDDLTKKP